MARLIVIDGDARGREFALGAAQQIGRLPANEIAVDDPAMSRHHTRVWRDGSAWWVEDLGSRNGTLVNDERVERQRLVDGDRLTVGGTGFAFVADSEDAARIDEPTVPGPRKTPLGPTGPTVTRPRPSTAADPIVFAGTSAEVRKKPKDKRLVYSPHAGRTGGGFFLQDLAQSGGPVRALLIALAVAAAAGLFWLVQHLVASS